MKVFFDNCTSPVLATTLDGYIQHDGDRAHHIKDLPCGRDADDLDWIEMLAEDNAYWIVMTGDDRIRRNKATRAAYRSADLRGFVLSPSYQKTPMHKVASFLLWRWPDVAQIAKIIGGAALYELPMNRTAKMRHLHL